MNEKIKRQKDRINKYSDENMKVFKRSLISFILYIIYVFIFVFVITAQIIIDDSYSNNHIKDIIKNEKIELPERYKFVDNYIIYYDDY